MGPHRQGESGSWTSGPSLMLSGPWPQGEGSDRFSGSDRPEAVVACIAKPNPAGGSLGDAVRAVESIGRRRVFLSSKPVTVSSHRRDSLGLGIDSTDRVVFRVDHVDIPSPIQA